MTESAGRESRSTGRSWRSVMAKRDRITALKGGGGIAPEIEHIWLERNPILVVG